MKPIRIRLEIKYFSDGKQMAPARSGYAIAFADGFVLVKWDNGYLGTMNPSGLLWVDEEVLAEASA